MPLCQTKCKRSQLLGTSFCLHQTNKSREPQGRWSSRAAFDFSMQQSFECSPAPHLNLAHGQESCFLHLAQVAHQSACHSSAHCSPKMGTHCSCKSGVQGCAMPVHDDPSCPNSSYSIAHVSAACVHSPCPCATA